MTNHNLDDDSANAETAQRRLKELEAIYQVSQQLLRLPATVESVLFRISQEALANVSKHAKASQVRFTCTKTPPNTVRLIIADNGIGIQTREATQWSPSSGWGMKIMRERAVSIGGNLWVESQSGNGTTLIIEIPNPTNGGLA
jgi:signal transduction histidine kinase